MTPANFLNFDIFPFFFDSVLLKQGQKEKKQMSNRLKSAEEMPGNYGLPYLGEVLELFQAQQLFYWRHFEKYGAVYKTKILNTKIACFVSPDANQKILKDEAGKFSSRQAWRIVEPILGEGLLLQDGIKHEKTRKIMYHAFHCQAIAAYYQTIKNTVEEFLLTWKYKENIELFNELRQLNLLLGCQLFLGIKEEKEIRKLSKWFSELVEGIRTVFRLDTPFTKYGRALIARRKIEEYLKNIRAKRRQQNNGKNVNDVLDLLISAVDENGNRLSDSEIITQSINLLYASHENLAKTLCWSLFELSRNPDWLDKLRQEYHEIIQEKWLDVSDLKRLANMEYVLKEVERLYPAVYTIPRAAIEDFEFDGYLVPKGWLVTVSPLLTHRLPEIYTEPDKFDPLRFSPPRQEDKKHPFALIGFGGGIHQCLGYELAKMEMKIILTTIFSKYDWTIAPKLDEISPLRQATKKLEEKMRLQVQPLQLANKKP